MGAIRIYARQFKLEVQCLAAGDKRAKTKPQTIKQNRLLTATPFLFRFL